MLSILVVDDNSSAADAMKRILQKQGYDVEAAYDGQTAIRRIEIAPPDLVLTDLKMEPIDGMAVLRAARAQQPPIEVIVFTAFGDVNTAVEAMRLGARDFLTKPVSVEQISERIRRMTGDPEPLDLDEPMSARSEVSQRLVTTLQRIADVPSPVWIEGELGTGRTHAAAQLHRFGDPEALFTPIDPSQPITWPESGTVVLNSVDALTDEEQVTLVRALNRLPEGVRLVSTASPDGRLAVAEGRIRPELFFTLAVVVVEIPPLRQRTEDIVPMFQTALKRFCERYNRKIPELSPTQQQSLTEHTWPGNLRELFNLAERTAVMGADTLVLQGSATPPPAAGVPVLAPGFNLSAHLEKVEKSILEEALRQSDGDRTTAGKLLGVERNTLRYKLNKYGLLAR